jgi:hypothetical protein
MVDVYPETSCLRSDRLTINLKRTNEDKANYLLECYTKGINPKSTWDSISGTVELILDTLSFAFQIPIRTIRFETLDMTPLLTIQTDRDWMFGSDIPSIHKNSKIEFFEEWSTKISPKLLSLSADDTVEAALRWYSKGLTASAIVDKFAFFWISLESLSLPVKPREKAFFKCPKCFNEIRECPECHNSSLHFPDTKERLRDLIMTKLGFSSSDFDSLWAERQMFHASNRLLENDIQQLLDKTVLLKKVVIRALKLRLGLKNDESPVLMNEGNLTMAGEPFMNGKRKITKEDIQSFLEAKPMLKATLYKGTHFLG